MLPHPTSGYKNPEQSVLSSQRRAKTGKGLNNNRLLGLRSRNPMDPKVDSGMSGKSIAPKTGIPNIAAGRSGVGITAIAFQRAVFAATLARVMRSAFIAAPWE